MDANSQKNCPKCQARAMKAWMELTGEQKFLVERLPGSADFTAGEREKHRFCTRCWFEETTPHSANV
jgi:hypothetical protein